VDRAVDPSSPPGHHLAALDLVRGTAIVLVVLVHSEQMVNLPQPWHSLASLGRYGVPLFFILSGYLMGYLHHEGTTWSVREFARRRAGRLLPAWWFFLGFWIIAFAVSPESPFALAGMDSNSYTFWFWAGVVLSFTLLNDLTPITANILVPGGWSISAESLHYALYIRVRRWGVRAILLAIAALTLGSSILWLAMVTSGSGWTPLSAWLVSWGPWATVPLFLTGVVLARVMPVSPRGRVRLMVLCAGMVAVAVSGAVSIHTDLDLLPLVLASGAASFFVLGTSKKVPRPMVRIGAVSYEMYFTQFVVLAVLERSPLVGKFLPGSWHSLAFILLVLALTYASALAVRSLISRPGRRLLERLTASSAATSQSH